MRRSLRTPLTPDTDRPLKKKRTQRSGGARKRNAPRSSRKRIARRKLPRRNPSVSSLRSFVLTFLAAFVLFVEGPGCAGRKPVASRQPAPAQPSPTLTGKRESAKRPTDVPDRPSNTTAAGRRRHLTGA